MSDEKKFRFCLHVDSTLTVDQIWPDGDAPENPTVEDVARVTGQWDSTKISVNEMCKLVDEWNLAVNGEASITKVTDDQTPNRDWCAEATRQRERAEKAEARVAELEAALSSKRLDGDISVREAARRAQPIDGADAQALEGALALTERERDEAHARVAELEGVLVDMRSLAPLWRRAVQIDARLRAVDRCRADWQRGDFVTCDECNETTPRGWPCGCDDGGEIEIDAG